MLQSSCVFLMWDVLRRAISCLLPTSDASLMTWIYMNGRWFSKLWTIAAIRPRSVRNNLAHMPDAYFVLMIPVRPCNMKALKKLHCSSSVPNVWSRPLGPADSGSGSWNLKRGIDAPSLPRARPRFQNGAVILLDTERYLQCYCEEVFEAWKPPVWRKSSESFNSTVSLCR